MTGIISRLMRPFSSTSTQLHFTPDTASGVNPNASLQLATFAAGCFWGVEHAFRRAFPADAVTDLRVGYIGGSSDSPSYRAVCTGSTGHAEALQLRFDPEKTSYRALVEFFYRMHDPTTNDRQGPDRGSQYRSAIFTHGQEQEDVAKEVTKQVQEQWWKSAKIVTQIAPAGKWFDGEDYHQQYLDNNPGGYECPSHFVRKFAPLQ